MLRTNALRLNISTRGLCVAVLRLLIQQNRLAADGSIQRL
jgi:hypothetical protein